MIHITAGDMHFKALNDLIRDTTDDTVVIDHCLGQRYIGSGLSHKKLVINGTPGNALGAYLDGASIVVQGNAQDATGDTMNDGVICIHGSAGDATGYAMRGGTILVEGNTGYRAGIHMKAYEHRLPTLVVGGKAGSFLGEYQAGGLIVVLNLTDGEGRFSCNFCGTGMHGGKIVVRCQEMPADLPPQLSVRESSAEDKAEITGCLDQFCQAFGREREELDALPFFVLTPNSNNPYKQLYTYR